MTSPRPSVPYSRPPEDVWPHGALPPPTASSRPLFEAPIKDDIFLTELPPSPAISTLTSRSTTRNIEAPRTVKFRLRNGLDTELGADNSCFNTASPKLRSWTRLRKDTSPASKEGAIEEQSKMNIWRSEVRRPKNGGLCLEEDERRKRKDEGKEEEEEADGYKLDEEMVMRVEEEDDRKEAEVEVEVQRPRPRRRKEADALVPRDWKQVPTDIVC
jgi:hypothetical protein